MYEFGERSLSLINQCDKRIQNICVNVIQYVDFTVLEGHRDEKKQNEMFATKKSKLKWPDSKHNSMPSLAIDIAPWPIIWPGEIERPQSIVKDYGRFYYLAGIFKAIAYSLGTPVRWGGDWNNNNDFTDQSFDDLPHFEIIEPK